MTTPDEPTTPGALPPTGPRGSEGLTIRPPVTATPPPVRPPETVEPEVAQPEVDEPAGVETGVPQSGVPQSGVPQSGVPQSGVPESGVPDNTAPEATVLEPTGPETSDETGDLAPARTDELRSVPDGLPAQAVDREPEGLAAPAPDPVVAADYPLPPETPAAGDVEPEDHLVFGEAPASSPGRSRAWLPLTAVGLAVALLAGGTGALAWQLRQQDRADKASVDAIAAARDAARLLFSYDHKTLQADFDKGLAVTTGDFRAQYQRTTKDVVSPVAVQYKAVVRAEVVEAAVIDARADEVTALVFLNQATTSTRVQGQQVDQSRVRMRLVPRDGRWLVEEVKAL